MTRKPQIILKQISKTYKLYNSVSDHFIGTFLPFFRKRYLKFQALQDINMEVYNGEILGIIGRNGSGKSTLLRIVAGITKPTEGDVEVIGNVIPLFELGAGFHRELTGRLNIRYYMTMLGFDKHRSQVIMEEAIAFADIGPFIDQPIKTYSRGMRARLAFSISIFVNPDILVIDEVMGVGDMYFKIKSHEKMRDLITSGKTILFVSHSEKEVKKVCTRAVMLHQGRLIKDGEPAEILDYYKNYYKSKKNKEKYLDRQ